MGLEKAHHRRGSIGGEAAIGVLDDLGTVRETDVLVMGRGLAGLPPAIAARDQGVDVTVMDKGGIERSGALAGIGHRLPWGPGGRGLR